MLYPYFFLIYGDFGFWDWGLGLVFFGLVLLVVGDLGVWCWALLVVRDRGSQYINKE